MRDKSNNKWICPKCGSNKGWNERLTAEVTDGYDGDRKHVECEIDRKNLIEIYCAHMQCELEPKDVG